MKTTKAIAVCILISLLITSLLVSAQSKSDKMYDAFANKDGISSFTFSKNMIDAINLDLGEKGEEKKVTGNLYQIRFMSYNPEKGSLSGYEFLEKAKGYLPKNSYKKYGENEGDSNAEIWLLGHGKKFSECHVFVKNDSEKEMQFVVSFFGDFTVSDLERLRKSGKSFSSGE